jgi:heme-degrading monooxygenase HmoA
MIAVIFEVWPADGRKEEYLDIAASLRAELNAIDGFISVERFQSLTDPKKLLSLSFWRDEEAVKAWRNQAHHRASQEKGRAGVFADYRLRIAAVVRDYGMTDRTEAPEDSRAAHDRQQAI